MKKRRPPSQRRPSGVKRLYARDVLKPKLDDRVVSVVIHDKAKGDTVIERLPSGRFATPTSAARIDETVTVYSVVLEELAKR